MEPGTKYFKDLYHPKDASTLFYESPKLISAEINYLNRIIIDYLVTQIPETIKYFKPIAFDNFDLIYQDLMNLETEWHSVNTENRLGYLGNSIAQRFGYITNHIQHKILTKCKSYLNSSKDNLLRYTQKFSLLEALAMIKIRQKARPHYNIILDILSDKSELEKVKSFIKNQRITFVIVEDSNYITDLLYGRYFVKSKTMINLSERGENKWIEIFNKLSSFLDMLQSIGIKWVYLHDANNLNSLSTTIVDNLKLEINILSDPELGYKTIISYLDFKLCESLTHSINGSSLCVGNSKLI